MPATPVARAPASAGSFILPALLFVSGAVALVYEVAGQRQFALVFGSAGPATAAVLAAYFAGLGTGAWIVGRLAPRWSRPLRAYAGLELLVGGGALLVRPALALIDSIYPALFGSLADQPAAFTAVRIALAFATLFLPTFAMGGTLPLLGAAVDARRGQLGRSAGWLYVVNTLGAGLGALALPFLFLPRLGLAASVELGVLANAGLAATAWALDRRTAPSAAPVPRPAAVPASADAPVLVPAFVSGFATFALQVLWNRAFAQIHENSLYSFAVVVAVVIFSLAAGAQLARLGLRAGWPPTRLLGGAWLLAAATVLAGPGLFLQLSHGLDYLPGAEEAGHHAARLAVLVCLLLGPAFGLLGVGLPAVMEQAGRGGTNASRVLGRLLAVNVLGSVAGALAAGFWLPRWLGLWNGILALGTLVAVAGVWSWRHGGASVRPRRLAPTLAVAWGASLLVLRHVELPRVRLEAGERLVHLAEGPHGIAAVVGRGDELRLKLNNHYLLGGTAATGDERMQAHMPLLLHPAPRHVAFLGLGTGISAGASLFHPVGRVTVMELVPEVVDAARSYFGAANERVLDDPRTVVVADDARNHLRGSREKYDVIIGDLVVPWRAGEGSLFTLEQFTAARAALAPDGLFCQWLPLFQLSETEATILARTFLQVFPQAQVWRGDFSPTAPAIALIGRAGDFKPDVALVQRRLAELRADPANPQLRSPDAFWMNLVGVLEASDLPAGEMRLNTEDRPWIELLGPLRPAGGQESFFTGRKLQMWLDQVRLRSRERLGPLPEREATAVAAGGELAEFTLCLAEGNRAGADAAQRRLREMLPADAYRSLFP